MADGEIVIHVNLDEGGFDAGSEKLIKAIEGITSAVNRLSKNLESGFTSSMKSINNVDLSKGTQTVQAATNAASNAVKNLASVTSQDMSRVASSYRDATEQFDTSRSTAKAEQLESAIRRVTQQANNLTRSSMKGFTTTNQILDFGSKVDNTANRVSELKAQLDKLHSTSVPTQEYAELTKQFEKAESQLTKLYTRQDELQATGKKFKEVKIDGHYVTDYTDAWRRLQYQIKNAEAEMARAEAAKTRLEQSGGDLRPVVDDKSYERLNNNLRAVQDNLKKQRDLVDTENLSQSKLNVLTAQQALAAAQTPKEIQKAQQALIDAEQHLQNLAQPVTLDQTESGWVKFGGVLKNVGSKALSAHLALEKMRLAPLAIGAKKAAQGFKALVSNLFKAKKHSNGLIKTLTSLKTLLKTRIKRMFISAILDNVGDAIKALALYDAEFNKAMSNMRNEAKRLAGNISVSLGGIVKQVEPIVTKILQLMNDLIVKANTVSAFLNNQETVTIAKKSTESYADSLDEVEKSTKKAAAAQKKLKAVLTSYDEIHRLDGLDDDIENPLEDLQDTFESVPVNKMFGEIPDYAGYLFKKIKEAIEKRNWLELGRLLGNGITQVAKATDNAVLNFEHTGKDWARNIARTLNGLTMGIDTTAIGKLIADSFNTALGIFDTFLNEYHWNVLGEKLSDGINAIVHYTDWALVGKTIGDGVSSIVDTVFAVVTNLDWSGVGTALGTELNALGDSINFTRLGDSVGALFSGLVVTTYNFVNTLDWSSVGGNIADALNGLSDFVDLELLASTLTSAFNGVMTGLGTFFEKYNWSEVGTKLGKSVIRLVKGINSSDLGRALEGVMKSGMEFFGSLVESWNEQDFSLVSILQDFVADLINSIDWKMLGKLWWKNFVSGFKWAGREVKNLLVGDKVDIKDSLDQDLKESVDNIQTVGEQISEGLIGGIDKGINKNKDIPKIFNKITDKAEDVYEIGSPSKVFHKIGDFLMQGLEGGIKDAITLVTKVVETVADSVKSLMTTAWNALIGKTKTQWGDITKIIKTSVSDVQRSVTSFSDILDRGIKSAFDKVQMSAEALKTSLSGVDMSSVGSNITKGIHDGINNTWYNNVSGYLVNMINTLWTDIYNHVNFYLVGQKIVEGMQDGVNSKWTEFEKAWIANMTELQTLTEAITKIGSPSKVYRGIGNYMTEGLILGIQDEEDKAVSTVTRMANRISLAASKGLNPQLEGFEEISFAEGTALTKIDRITERLSEIPKGFLAVANAMRNLSDVQIPQVMLGAVIPARVKSEATAPAESDSDAVKILQQIMNLLKQPVESTQSTATYKIEIPVTLDNRAVGRGQAELSLRNGRMMNGGGRR